MLKSVAEFTRTTLIGGVLVVLPIYVSVLLLAKAITGVIALISPVTATLPVELQFRQIIAVIIAVAVCFIAGLILRTGHGLRAKNALERVVLERIPGYALVRGLAGRVTGQNQDETFAVALIEIEDALVPGFVVEEHDDGNYTVFVPSVPTPAAGAIYILPRNRVHICDVPFTRGVSVISKWGTGARDLVKAMQPAIERRPSAGP